MKDLQTMKKQFLKPIKEPISLSLNYKIVPSKGNMSWEYNPFRNYRLAESKFYFRDKYLNRDELLKELEVDIDNFIKGNLSREEKIEKFFKRDSWDEVTFKGENIEYVGKPINPSIEDNPILYDIGQLVDFDTTELNFSVNHPVDILPQYSYDGSVNLILNDGINKPRLINSRFSALGRNKYLIVDRSGDNDTNIYDQGVLFDVDTSLYKTYNQIPRIEYLGTLDGGNLKVGNYHFYFRYLDADGNETDFVGETGIVSIFKGNYLDSINGGFINESSQKSVRFILSNIDSAYKKISVYYTRSTSDILLNSTTLAFKILDPYIINNNLNCIIRVSGYEDILEITIDEVNPTYLIALNVYTLASCLNILFIGNINKEHIPYEELSDLSLRFIPKTNVSKKYTPISHNYNLSPTNTYSDSKFIYNYTGYLNNEFYRLGIVYILSSGTLSPVYNIRGVNNSETFINYKVYDKDSNRNYIKFNEDSGILYDGNGNENAYGIIQIENPLEFTSIAGIDIEIDDQENVYLALALLLIKGFFFVRQKRIPLRLCLAYTIGIDSESHTPLLYVNKDIKFNVKSDFSTKHKYISERFLSDSRVIEHNIDNRFYCIDPKDVSCSGAICPEYDINSPYYNTLFNGSEYYIKKASTSYPLMLDVDDGRHFFVPELIDTRVDNSNISTLIIGVEDNVKLVETNYKLFSSRAGEAEEAFRFEFLGRESKTTKCNNIIRGSFGPFIGFGSFIDSGYIVNIYVKDAFDMSFNDLLKIRKLDSSPFYAISDRFTLDLINNIPTLYRGDSYICTFTHRVNRNFLDPSSPTNDKIVDKNCWKNNFEITDEVINTKKFEKINLGDINAVKLGMWVTIPIISSYNLNIRTIDSSNPDEISLFGYSRGFYPYYSMMTDGSYKIPEALCYNLGFCKSLSERYNFLLPDVPAIKNDFTNRIAYSNIHVNDAFTNGFRTFLGTHYRDYPKTYGQITKLIELRGNLICIFEHGIALIPVNERAVAGEGAGGNVYINTSNVLPENPKIISDTFGSLWKDSIIKTPMGVYGVDTIGKKIWRTNGENFECISDFKVQEFLNLNISLLERELNPVIGVRNVKTHYNKFKHDVMFTFYDNLYGFEEKVWNLCYNELQLKWITFYSWIPSYSENIHNLYFSFDRNTSKWITKLGVSNASNDFSDGVVLTNNIIPNNAKSGYIIGELNLANRTLPEGKGINVDIIYSLENDNFGNCNNFEIYPSIELRKPHQPQYLRLKVDATELCSELFVRGIKDINSSGNKYKHIITNPKNLKLDWINNCVLDNNYVVCKDELGRRINLSSNDPDLEDLRLNPEGIVTLLNIRANVIVTYEGETPTLAEAYTSGFKNGTEVSAGYYQSVIAVTPKYNMQFLTTDFWKHGLAGIIDIADKIYPTYWYGKQHPFEFEFVVADNPQLHKIFDNLEIISNNAEPQSFHYEIIGDCFEFAKDKKNMYIRQEATKELYQNNGFDVLYDREYINLLEMHRPLLDRYGNKIPNKYDKSTLFPLYYSRRDSFNEIEDFYHSKDGAPTKDFSARSGAELVRYENLGEYRIWNHAKAVDLNDRGRIRGNMQYKEDKWYIQINPINIVLKNEGEWNNDLIPIELGLSPIPDDVLSHASYTGGKLDIPSNLEHRDVIVWNWQESLMKEVKMKDKWIKIRIRYKGNKLAIITAIRTLYSASYA